MSSSLFFTGLSGLRASQVALVTTGHNTANVNTPGYSRQSATLTAAGGVRLPSVGFIGGGVKVSDVTRSQDAYLNAQLNQAQSLSQSLSTSLNQISQLDNLLANPQTGLGPRLQTLFTHVQAVANTPADPAARQQLISSGQALASQFRSMDDYLTGLSTSINSQVSGVVDQVNAYATQIASLNQQVTMLGSANGGQAPNDLLDQRDQLVNELGKLVATRLVVQDGGQYNVFIGSGQSLVLGNKASQLAAVPSGADPSRTSVALVNAAGRAVEMQEGTLSGGTLGGLLSFRSQTLAPAQNALGRLAIGLAQAFNEQQRLGQDLTGAAGTDFFTQAQPQVLSHARNAGTLQLSASFADTAALGTSDFKLQVRESAGVLSYALIRLPESAQGSAPVATFASLPADFEGVRLSAASGTPVAGDSFLIQPTRQGARDLQVLVTDPARVAAAAPIATANVSGNLGSARVGVGSVDAAYLAAPLSAPVNLRFDSAAQQLTGFPAAAVEVTRADGSAHPGSPFAAGSAVDFESGATYRFGGISLRITGTPADGDMFSVAPNTGGVSDGRNALMLGGLQNAKTLGGGTASFNDAYSQLVSSVGNQTRQIQIAGAAQDSLSAQIRAVQQSVAGVNQDEETANLLMFQQMYQANAKVIQTAATLFDTLIGIRG